MRAWVLLISLAAMLALVAACGDDDSGDNDEAASADTTSDVSEDESPTPESEQTTEATAESEPTATATPERTPESTSDPEPTPPEDSETETEDPAQGESVEGDASDEQESTASEQTGELGALLLTVDDFPADWTEAAIGAGTSEEVGDIVEDPFVAPCGVEPIDEIYDPAAQEQRTFQATELGPFVSQNVVQLDSSDKASEAMAHIRELFGCEEWVESDEFGEEMTFEITESDVQGVGDDVLSFRLGLSLNQEPEMEMFGDFGFDIVFFQRGEMISTLMYMDLFGMGEIDLQSLAQLADERIQAGP